MGSPRSGNPSTPESAHEFDGFLLRNKPILRVSFWQETIFGPAVNQICYSDLTILTCFERMMRVANIRL
jgi:hypothetical protein